MKDVELDSEDLNLVDDIFNALDFNVDGQVSAGDVRKVLEEMEHRQITKVYESKSLKSYRMKFL